MTNNDFSQVLNDRWSIIHYTNFLDAFEHSVPTAKHDLLLMLPLFGEITDSMKVDGRTLEDVVRSILEPQQNFGSKDIKVSHLLCILEEWVRKYKLESNRLFIHTALHFLADVHIYDREKFYKTNQVPTRLSDGIPVDDDENHTDFGSTFPFLFLPLPNTELMELLKLKGIEPPGYHNVASLAENYESPLNVRKRCRLTWNPAEMTWTEFNKLLNQMFDNYKRAYRQRTEDTWKHKTAKLKRESLHYQWLVDYQVKGMSHHEIANLFTEKTAEDIKTEGYLANTVYKAVVDTAALVGLTLRPDKGGRPRSSQKGRK